MERPDVVHPTTFKIDGIVFQVVAYAKLTDKQAATVAMQFYQTHHLQLKRSRVKSVRVEALWEDRDLGLL